MPSEENELDIWIELDATELLLDTCGPGFSTATLNYLFEVMQTHQLDGTFGCMDGTLYGVFSFDDEDKDTAFARTKEALETVDGLKVKGFLKGMGDG